MKEDKLGEEIREALMDLAEEQDERLEEWEKEHPEEGMRLQEIADQMDLRITKPVLY